MSNYTHLKSGSSNFSDMMLNNSFGIVTVMNAKVYDYETVKSAFESATGFDGSISGDYICELKTLKIANVTVEGPTKSITGGQYSNPLIKYGKTARLEMQDALGNSKVLEALNGGLNEWDNVGGTGTTLAENVFPSAGLKAFHYGEDFSSAKTIVGDSFFIDKVSGQQVKVKIVFYQFMPDSLFNLTQDAEGDATVFDLNGDLLVTDVKIPNQGGVIVNHGLFYSILQQNK